MSSVHPSGEEKGTNSRFPTQSCWVEPTFNHPISSSIFKTIAFCVRRLFVSNLFVLFRPAIFEEIRQAHNFHFPSARQKRDSQIDINFRGEAIIANGILMPQISNLSVFQWTFAHCRANENNLHSCFCATDKTRAGTTREQSAQRDAGDAVSGSNSSERPHSANQIKIFIFAHSRTAAKTNSLLPFALGPSFYCFWSGLMRA